MCWKLKLCIHLFVVFCVNVYALNNKVRSYVLEPPKPFNLTLFKIVSNQKFLNVLWYTSETPDFFTIIVCQLETLCYSEIVHNATTSSSTNNRWTQQINISLETGRHRLYVVSHYNNVSANATTDFIIGKNWWFLKPIDKISNLRKPTLLIL